MPTVPIGPNPNLTAYGQSPATPSPGMGNLLMAAAVQAQDPSRSMPEGQDRPRLPARAMAKRTQGLLKTRLK
jgi:hypothetical protein